MTSVAGTEDINAVIREKPQIVMQITDTITMAVLLY